MASPETTPLAAFVNAVRSSSALDTPGRTVGRAVRRGLRPGALKDALSGSWLGHPLHPLLTDVVIGSFTSASVLDLVGGDRDGRAARRLIALGIAAYAPTALSGVSDWADSEVADPAVRRIGLVHATANSVAVSLYVASLRARRRGQRARGKLLGFGGAGVLALGGYLGGDLSYTRGVGPNQTAFDPGPDDWTVAADASVLRSDAPTSVVVGETPVLFVRQQDELYALHDRCSHRGCSLAGGELAGDVIRCACHGSEFRLRDGSVARGPATASQPVFEVRQSGERVEIRRAPAG